MTDEPINKSDLIGFRAFEEDDFNFIISSWLQGLYHGNEFFNLIDKKTYFDKYHTIIENILKTEFIHCTIACLKDSPDVILGYSIFSKTLTGSVLHWLFVKEVWRKIGIGTKLIPENTTEYSHFSTVGLSIQQQKFPQLKFNPFAIGA